MQMSQQHLNYRSVRMAGAGAGDSARAGCALVQLCPAPAAAVQWEVTVHVYCLLATAEP